MAIELVLDASVSLAARLAAKKPRKLNPAKCMDFAASSSVARAQNPLGFHKNGARHENGVLGDQLADNGDLLRVVRDYGADQQIGVESNHRLRISDSFQSAP